MKKTSPTTYKVGSIGEFAAWTKRVVCDPKAAREFPKKWFDSEEAAARAEQVSAEAMSSCCRRAISRCLMQSNVTSRHRCGELAALTGRKEASLSRTLKRFAQLGIVAFEEGPHRIACARRDRNPRPPRNRPDWPPHQA